MHIFVFCCLSVCLCLALEPPVFPRANKFSVLAAGVHERGNVYGGYEDGYDMSKESDEKDSDSSSKKSSSDSKSKHDSSSDSDTHEHDHHHCECPTTAAPAECPTQEPATTQTPVVREKCEPHPTKAPLFIATGFVNSWAAGVQWPKRTCYCNTGILNFYKSTNKGYVPAVVAAETAYTFWYKKHQMCPGLCFRVETLAGPKFLVPVGSADIVDGSLLPKCSGLGCYSYLQINPDGSSDAKLKYEGSFGSPVYDKTTCEFTGEEIPQDCKVVSAMSCIGCDVIRGNFTESCYQQMEL